jgi:hypothetical protein
MRRTHHRFLLTFTAGVAAVAVSAGPALAGSDGCSGGDCQDENTPAAVVPVAPAPVAPLRTDQPDFAPAHSTQPSHHVRARHVARRTRTRELGVVRRTVPRGAVAAGAGGMAPRDADGVLAILAGGGLVLLAAGGGLVASGRRTAP